MSRRTGSIMRTGACAAVLIVLAARPVLAIRPVIIMFYGGALKQPVFVTDTMVFHDLENPTTITARELGGREYLSVAMFWGTQWERYLAEGKPVGSLTPEMAGQHGRFYPATSDRPAVLLQTKPQLAARPVPRDSVVLDWGGELEPSWLPFLLAKGVPAAARRNGGR